MWAVGGPAERFFIPADEQDLARWLAGRDADEPLTWLGLGSNLLVRDGGVAGDVVALKNTVAGTERLGGGSIAVGAGTPCAKVARLLGRE